MKTYIIWFRSGGSIEVQATKMQTTGPFVTFQNKTACEALVPIDGILYVTEKNSSVKTYSRFP